MDTFIYIKYGELSLKGNNKNVFINTLFRNIKNSLKDFENLKIIKEYDNIKIFNYDNQEKIINILKWIPGINLIIPAKIIPRDIEILKDEIFKLTLANKTFKIFSKRKDKTYEINSDNLNRIIASYILKNNSNIKVDVHNPEILVSIEVTREEFIFFERKINGIGGFPTGINSRALVMLSGGIDSPVAGHLLQKKGMYVDYVTFMTPPYTSLQALQKVKDLVKIITVDGRVQNSRLFIINFTPLLHELNHIKDDSYRITLMRRSFFRIAKMIAKKINAKVIATGESIGQVASQTIESMDVISSSINDILIYRPLLCMDKNEIINLSKQIKTYEISIKPYDDSCSLFSPKNPTTKPSYVKVNKFEKELFMIDNLEKSIIKKIFQEEVNHDK